MSDYNINTAFASFIEAGAYLARDLQPLDEVTDLRVEQWRTSAMSLVRVGTSLFKEIDKRDTYIAKLERLLKERDGGAHDADCNMIYGKRCDCLHDEVVKYFEGKR